MEAFNIENFKNLMITAFDITEATDMVRPVFENVPEKLRNFASKTIDVVGAKANLSLSSLKELSTKEWKDWKNSKTNKKNPLNLDMKKDQENSNVPLALNWVVKLLKDVIDKLNEHGDIIRVHTEVLANPEEALNIAKNDLDALKLENEKLKVEIDETRQRGMKGNIVVSSPMKNGQTKAVHQEVPEGVNKRLETDTEMVIRLINEKAQVQIPLDDVVACHPMGDQDKHTYVIRVLNRKPGSAWYRLTAAMMKATNMDRKVNVYLNFQLTQKRAALAKEVRKARTDGKVAAYSVDQNGKIKVKTNGGTRYETVTSVENLNRVIS